MPNYNYKEKVINFINDIHSIIDCQEDPKQQKLISILQKMLFYAEQYFIEKSMQYRKIPHKTKEIEKEKKEVLNRLKSYAEAIEKLNHQTQDMIAFLDFWQKKLEYEQSFNKK